jgi:hypothetical protein
MRVFEKIGQWRQRLREQNAKSNVGWRNRPVLTRGLVTVAIVASTALSFSVLESSPAAPDSAGSSATASTTGDTGSSGAVGNSGTDATTTTTTSTTSTTTTTTPPAGDTSTTPPAAGPAAQPNLKTSSSVSDGTVTWTGNGTTNGKCDGTETNLGPIPNGEMAWLFILTSPGAGPWELTTNLGDAAGTQQGGGAIHFVLFTPLDSTLTSASAVTGTGTSVLTVSGCQSGTPLTPTTISTTVFDATTGVAWSGTETVGAAASDTATVGGTQVGTPLTGTVTYTFFTNGTCDGDGTVQTAGIVGGVIPHSPPTLSLAAGSYSYEAVYSGDSNYAASPVGECEPFSVGMVPTTTATVLDDAATSAPWTGDETTGAKAFDTSTVSGGIVGFVPTGTVTYTLFDNGTCALPLQTEIADHAVLSMQTVTLNPDGSVPNSATTAALTPGNYSFDAGYSGDSNYDASPVSDCEPFSVGDGPTTTATVLKDAATNPNWAGTEVAGATAYDTSTVSGAAGGIVPTGTVTYSYFTNAGCSGTPVSTEPVTLNPDGTVPNSSTTAALAAGSYSFDAVYGGDSNYSASAVSDCEPFTVAAGATAASTVTATPTTPAAVPTPTPPTPPKAAPSAIAFTGADLYGMSATGLALLGLGGLFILMARRRKGQPS